MDLPNFKYHPDPIATESIVKSDTKCCCCGKVHGYIYVGPVYAIGDYDDCICPWCIADGSAHEKFDVSFTDTAGIGGYGDWDKVPEDVVDEVAYRTPGFYGWQQEQWWTHCGDAGQFLGRVGHKELEVLGNEAISAIKDSVNFNDRAEWEEFFFSLEKEGAPTAYLFRCNRCGKLGGYWDCH